jgi:large subunit ribosomal protein L10
MKRSEKEETVAGLKRSLAEAQAVFVTDFKGIDMEALTGLRVKVREAGCEFKVAKNTMVKLAARNTPLGRLEHLFVGNNALGRAVSDPVVLAKVLTEFAKTNDKLVIKGGVLGGKTMTPAQIKALASLPGREALLAAFLGTLNAVPAGLARVLAAVPRKLLYALTAIRDRKEKALA